MPNIFFSFTTVSNIWFLFNVLFFFIASFTFLICVFAFFFILFFFYFGILLLLENRLKFDSLSFILINLFNCGSRFSLLSLFGCGFCLLLGFSLCLNFVLLCLNNFISLSITFEKCSMLLEVHFDCFE